METIGDVIALTPAQWKCHAELKKRVSELTLTDRQRLWADDACLRRYVLSSPRRQPLHPPLLNPLSYPTCPPFRFLRARDFHVDHAFTMIKAALEWREQFQVHNLPPDMIALEASSSKMWVGPTDRLGHPIIIMKPRFENTYNHDSNIKYLVYTLGTPPSLCDPMMS
jgi:hypothetical protein